MRLLNSPCTSLVIKNFLQKPHNQLYQNQFKDFALPDLINKFIAEARKLMAQNSNMGSDDNYTAADIVIKRFKLPEHVDRECLTVLEEIAEKSISLASDLHIQANGNLNPTQEQQVSELACATRILTVLGTKIQQGIDDHSIKPYKEDSFTNFAVESSCTIL